MRRAICLVAETTARKLGRISLDETLANRARRPRGTGAAGGLGGWPDAAQGTAVEMSEHDRRRAENEAAGAAIAGANDNATSAQTHRLNHPNRERDIIVTWLFRRRRDIRVSLAGRYYLDGRCGAAASSTTSASMRNASDAAGKPQ